MIASRVRAGRRVLAAVVAVLVVASCGSGGSGGQQGGGPVPEGGTLRVALGQPESDLNVLDFKTHSFSVLDQIYEPLLRYGKDGKLTPALATSWQTSKDGRMLTFQLRKGVQFSDGTTFDAAVAKQSMQRWLGKDANSFLGITKNVRSMSTPGDHTLVVRMKRPYYPALQELTVVRPSRFPSPKSFDDDGKFLRPVGTGPYQLRSSSQTQIVLERNADYWGGRPNLDQVVFKVIPSSQGRLAALKAGEVDIIGGEYLAPLAPEETTDLKASQDVRLLTGTSATNLLLAYNTEDGNPALADRRVRQAINLAVDRDGYAKALFHGLAKPATQLFPPSIPYAPDAESRPLTRDQAKAGALLDDAGFTGSGTRAKGKTKLSFRLILDPDLLPQARALSEAVQADLAKIGVKVTIDSMDSTSYADAYAKRDYDLKFYLTYGPPYDPFGMLNGEFRTTRSTNLYSSKHLDGLIDTALAATTEEKRSAAYTAAWTELNDEWAVAPLVELPRIWAARTAVRGFSLGPTEYDLPLSGVGIAP